MALSTSQGAEVQEAGSATDFGGDRRYGGIEGDSAVVVVLPCSTSGWKSAADVERADLATSQSENGG